MRWVLLASLALAGCGKVATTESPRGEAKAEPRREGERPEAKKTLAEWGVELRGKTKDEVKKVLGKPDASFESLTPGEWCLSYSARHNLAWNPDTEQPESFTVAFDKAGKCYKVGP